MFQIILSSSSLHSYSDCVKLVLYNSRQGFGGGGWVGRGGGGGGQAVTEPSVLSALNISPNTPNYVREQIFAQLRTGF